MDLRPSPDECRIHNWEQGDLKVQEMEGSTEDAGGVWVCSHCGWVQLTGEKPDEKIRLDGTVRDADPMEQNA